jgi:hypothetical protein
MADGEQWCLLFWKESEMTNTTSSGSSGGVWGVVSGFLSEAGTEVELVWNKIEAGITTLEAGLSVAENAVVNSVPQLVAVADAALNAIKTAGDTIVADFETAVADGEALLQNLEKIFQTSASQGPGGEPNP